MSASKTRVLIIEDNDALRVMLFTVLRHQPLGVDTAISADEAMDKVTTCDYALILLDMNLPNGDSLSFLRRFREERADVGTFILAVRDPKVEVELDPTMVSAVVNKPLEIDTLADVVRECALVIPPPENPLPCPPPDSDAARARLDDSGSFMAN
jgi:DNA-binding response OmpR family regulator